MVVAKRSLVERWGLDAKVVWVMMDYPLLMGHLDVMDNMVAIFFGICYYFTCGVAMEASKVEEKHRKFHTSEVSRPPFPLPKTDS